MVSIVGIDPGSVKRKTCRKCASILEYTESEEKSYISYDYGGGSDRYYYIKCPKCSNKVITR